MAASDPQIKGVDDLVVLLENLAEDRETVSVFDLIEGLGEAARLPLIMTLALVVVSPLSGIPLLPSTLGLMIALLSLQIFIGKRVLWLPGIVRRRELSSLRLRQGAKRLHGLAQWLDRNSRRRFQLLVGMPVRAFLPLVIALCGAVMPLLELVPFSSSLLGMAITLICTGMILADGLWIALALLFISTAASIPAALYF